MECYFQRIGQRPSVARAFADELALYKQEQARQFSDRDLRDVGLTRSDLYREFARPFWRAEHSMW